MTSLDPLPPGNTHEPGADEPATAGHDESLTVISAATGWVPLDLRELWRYRELLGFLALRNVRVRYKQAVLGVGWAILQPLATILVFGVLFSLMGRKPTSPGVPYAVSAYCALLPWQYFASAVLQAGTSVVSNQNLVRKVYFPRLLIPATPVVSELVNFAVAFSILLAMMVFHGITPGLAVLALPLFLALAVATAFAVGLWVSALNAIYRDVGYVIPLALQLGMFVTPVVYDTATIVPERWRLVYGLNPMAGVVEGFRWALLGKAEPPGGMFLVSTGIVLALLVGGAFYFRRMERSFADLV